MAENNEVNKPVVEDQNPAPVVEEKKVEDVLYPDKDVKVEDTPAKEAPAPEGDKKDDKPADQPENDEIELVVPAESSLTDEDVKEIKEFAKANKLSKEVAQKLLDDKQGLLTKITEKQNADLKAQSEGWLKEIKQIKTFDEDLKATQQVLADYFDPEFKKMLNESGLGNHPALFKGLAKLGKAMNPKPLVPAPKNAAARKLEDWEVFYGADEKSG